jgi:hypothetical protein
MRKNHHSHQVIIVTFINSISRDQTGGSRSLPPMERPNLGKSLSSPCLYAVESTNTRFPQNPNAQSMDIAVFTPHHSANRPFTAAHQGWLIHSAVRLQSSVSPKWPSPQRAREWLRPEAVRRWQNAVTRSRFCDLLRVFYVKLQKSHSTTTGAI